MGFKFRLALVTVNHWTHWQVQHLDGSRITEAKEREIFMWQAIQDALEALNRACDANDVVNHSPEVRAALMALTGERPEA